MTPGAPRRAPARTDLRVLEALLPHAASGLHGRAIATTLAQSTGTISPALTRMLSQGWVTAEHETVRPGGGPRRTFYRATDNGARVLREHTTTITTVNRENR